MENQIAPNAAAAVMPQKTDISPIAERMEEPEWHGQIIRWIAALLGIVLLLSSVFVGSFFYTLSSFGDLTKSEPTAALLAMGILTKAAFGILAIYFGASALLAGAATAFYSGKGMNSANGNAGGISFAIATASPAVMSVIAGAVIIVYVLLMPLKFEIGDTNMKNATKSGSNLVLPDLPPPTTAIGKDSVINK